MESHPLLLLEPGEGLERAVAVGGGVGWQCFPLVESCSPLTRGPALTIVRTPRPSSFRAAGEMICCR